GFADQAGDRQRADIAGDLDSLRGLDRVGDDELVEPRGSDAGDRAAGQHAVGDIRVDLDRALVQERIGGVHNGSAGIDDVIDQDAGIAFDLADNVHDFGLAGALASFVDDRERRVDALGEPAGAADPAYVGRDHHHLTDIETLLDVTHHHRRGVEIVGRDVEKSLNLPGVEIKRHHAIGAGARDQVGYKLGRDRGARRRFAVLSGIAEI